MGKQREEWRCRDFSIFFFFTPITPKLKKKKPRRHSPCFGLVHLSLRHTDTHTGKHTLVTRPRSPAGAGVASLSVLVVLQPGTSSWEKKRTHMHTHAETPVVTRQHNQVSKAPLKFCLRSLYTTQKSCISSFCESVSSLPLF